MGEHDEREFIQDLGGQELPLRNSDDSKGAELPITRNGSDHDLHKCGDPSSSNCDEIYWTEGPRYDQDTPPRCQEGSNVSSGRERTHQKKSLRNKFWLMVGFYFLAGGLIATSCWIGSAFFFSDPFARVALSIIGTAMAIDMIDCI